MTKVTYTPVRVRQDLYDALDKQATQEKRSIIKQLEVILERELKLTVKFSDLPDDAQEKLRKITQEQQFNEANIFNKQALAAMDAQKRHANDKKPKQ